MTYQTMTGCKNRPIMRPTDPQSHCSDHAQALALHCLPIMSALNQPAHPSHASSPLCHPHRRSSATHGPPAVTITTRKNERTHPGTRCCCWLQESYMHDPDAFCRSCVPGFNSHVSKVRVAGRGHHRGRMQKGDGWSLVS